MHIKTENGSARVVGWNPRAEHHGDDLAMAGDIDIVVNQPVEKLSEITIDKADWRSFLYKSKGEVKGLCFNKINFFRELEDMDITLAIDDDSVLQLHAEKVKKISAEIKDGFRVDIKFQVQVHVNEEQSGEIHAARAMHGIDIELQEGGKQKHVDEVAA